MLEVYVILTLAGIGYLLNQSSSKNNSNIKNTYLKNETPSMNNVYDSTFANETLRLTGQKVENMFNKSNNPRKTGVISKNYNFLKENNEDIKKQKIQTLDGRYVNKTDFTHNNMVPFFGGSVKQNVESFTNDAIMLNANGTDSLYKQKKEVKTFFDTCQDVGNINGTANQTDYYRDRIAEPIVKNNVFPVPQVKVGPGLNQGFSATPTGGYQQLDMLDYVKFKNVDDLRVANKPKLSFNGVTIDGLKSSVRGDLGAVEKNRPETFWEQTPDMWMKTTGAFTKAMDIPEQIVKDTNRQDITTEYVGTAYGHDQQSRTADPSVRDPLKPQYGSFDLANPAASTYGKGNADDFGKSKILVYNNERDITSTRVYQGNLTSLIKSIAAPVIDMIKITKKEEFIDNPRHFGNMGIQIPSKQTIYDPNDIAKTTIKESLIHDTTINNLTGPKQLYVYDPDDIARTTMRQTTESIDNNINLTGKSKIQVYTNDPTKKTLKETTIDSDRYGNIDKLEGQAAGGYQTNEWDARLTQKSIISDNDYYGQVKKDMGLGYEVNEWDARLTQKSILSDNDYYGTAATVNAKKEISKQDIENARITPNIETLLFNRKPTDVGAKEFIGKESAESMSYRKYEDNFYADRGTQNTDRVYNEIPSTNEVLPTKMGKDYRQPDAERLDINILKTMLDNPLNIDLSTNI